MEEATTVPRLFLYFCKVTFGGNFARSCPHCGAAPKAKHALGEAWQWAGAHVSCGQTGHSAGH